MRRNCSLVENQSQNDEMASLLLVFSRGAKMRRKILSVIEQNYRNCHEIAKELRVDWWTVRKHLSYLKEAKLVHSWNLGRIEFYKITAAGSRALKRANDFPLKIS